MRRAAADALGTLKAAKAVAPLIDLLADINLYVRSSAQEALTAITGQRFPDDKAWRTWLESNESRAP